MRTRQQSTQQDRRKAAIAAILDNNKTMLQLIADERSGKVIIISNQAEEEIYLMRIYKAVMCADSSELVKLPEPTYVNGYTSVLHNFFKM